MIKKVKEPAESAEYIRLIRTDHNLFKVEVIRVEGDRVVDKNTDEEGTYLPIAFDKMRRKTGEQFFRAVQAEHDGAKQ